MTVISADVPEGLLEDIRKEVETGRYQSQSELIRDAIRRLMEERYSTDEELPDNVIESIERAREQDDAGPIEALIED